MHDSLGNQPENILGSLKDEKYGKGIRQNVAAISTTVLSNFAEISLSRIMLLKFRRVTIRGAQPSARLSEEIGLSEGSAGVSERAPRGLSEGSAGSLRGSAGVRGIFRGFRG